MLRTVLFLIFTLIVVPIVAFRFDEPLNDLQREILRSVGIVYIITSMLCFVVSTVAKNYSQVDKLWSIMPVVYAWMIAHGSGFDARVVLMALLVTVWGIRLTYNFNRRGGYSWKFWTGEQDYRWAIVQAKPEFQPAWKWTVFNLFFICYYQMGLLLLIALPLLKAIGGGPLGIWDYVLSALFIGFTVIETLADQQQWDFQQEKHRLLKAGKPLPGSYKKGFIHTGLWGVVRHPNYAAEQAVWIIIYAFSIVATGHWINWSIAGCLLLVLLFKGSSDFSEEISASKYPGYSEYQKKVPRFLPRP